MAGVDQATARARAKAAPMGSLLILLLLVFAAVEAAMTLVPAIGRPIQFGGDLEIYLGATRRFLEGGSFYPPDQLTHPYQLATGVVLYPPTTIPLLAAFTVLPAILWWAIPISITAYVVARCKPSILGWALIAVCLAFPDTIALLVYGNPAMWAMAVLALATRQPWVSAFILLKPSLLPLAVIGIRDRRWWAVVAVPAIASLTLLPVWGDYLTVLLNLRGSDILYSVGDIPMVLIPAVAWAARRPPGGSASSGARIGTV